MRARLLPYGHQQIDDDDVRAVVDVLRSEWLTTGPKVVEFEQVFAERVGARHAVTFSSGTAALHGAAFAAGLGPGDQAVTSPLTFCATANAVLYQGATPVFADVSPDTLNLDPEQASALITTNTKALVVVDYAGHPAELDAFRELAERSGLMMIEDAAHALGAEYRGQRIGGLAALTVFSFHPVKHITTGEGGMVTTNDLELARRLRLFRNHGITTDARQRQGLGHWHYEMVTLGYNYRLSDVAAALGLSQLTRLSANLARRRQVAQRYTAALGPIPEIHLPVERLGVASAWHLYPIRLRLDRLSRDRAEIFAALRAENIGVNVHYIPVHKHPYYRERFGEKTACPIAEAAYSSLVTLPLFHAMTDGDVEDVIAAVEKVVAHYRR